HEMDAGPSNVGARPSRRLSDNESVSSAAERVLLDDLRCVANRRRVFAFDLDAVSLRK
ncbi:hypothetical protein J3R82DRAFT_2685, partial [Butyriboletus roseoflavus]